MVQIKEVLSMNMEIILSFIIMSVVSVILLVCGIFVYNGHTGLVHWYHTANIKKEMLPFYAKSMGKAIIVISIIMFIFGFMFLINIPVLYSTIFFLIAFVIDFIYIYIIQIKYNGGMFSKRGS